MNQKIINKNFLITLLCFFVLGSCMNPIQKGNVLTITTSSGVSQGTFNKNVVTRNQPYGQRPRIIEEDPDYEDFMRFKAMKYNTDKEFRKDNLKVNNQSNNQLNELLLYIFTGFFLLIIYDNMYHFGKKSY